MKPEVGYNKGHGWFIYRYRDPQCDYLHYDGIWRKSMWNDAARSYGYFSNKLAAEIFLASYNKSPVYSMYDVLAVYCADHTIDTHLYYYAVDKTDAWIQAFAGNNGWYVSNISLVS